MYDKEKVKTVYNIIENHYKAYGIIKLSNTHTIRRTKKGELVLLIDTKPTKTVIGLYSILKYMYDDKKKPLLRFTESKMLIQKWYNNYKEYKAKEESYYD